MKTTKQMIEIMTAYVNGAEIERTVYTESSLLDDTWYLDLNPKWDWKEYDYRIKEQKKTITIEKWLCEYPPLPTQHGGYFVIEKQVPFILGSGNKVKLLHSYEVEL